MPNNLAISISNLSKMYRIGTNKEGALRHSLSNVFKSNTKTRKDFWALKDVSFELKTGEVLGVIGKNGAGKSTLLKLLSQITRPTEGRIEINGRLASLLEVGTGFHPELTGRENIYLNGTILGMSRKEVRTKFDEIVAFSGVEKFIDTAVKHYSSGMHVRLAFAVAAHLEPEILIIDEVLAVGDAEFQKKCLGKMKDVSNAGRTVIFVSHNMSAVKELCTRGVVLKEGRLVYDGTVDAALNYYNQTTWNQSLFFDTSDYSSRKRGVHDIYIKSVALNSAVFNADSPITFEVKLGQNIEFTNNINLAIFVFDELNNNLYQLSTLLLGVEVKFQQELSYVFSLNSLNLSQGLYKVGVWLEGGRLEQDYVEEDICFEVESSSIYPNKTARIVSSIQKEFDFKTIEK